MRNESRGGKKLMMMEGYVQRQEDMLEGHDRKWEGSVELMEGGLRKP